MIASKPSEPNDREISAVTTIFDQQFGLWSAMMRMSPLPFVLQQQVTVAKLFLGFMLPTDRRLTWRKEKGAVMSARSTFDQKPTKAELERQLLDALRANISGKRPCDNRGANRFHS